MRCYYSSADSMVNNSSVSAATCLRYMQIIRAGMAAGIQNVSQSCTELKGHRLAGYVDLVVDTKDLSIH